MSSDPRVLSEPSEPSESKLLINFASSPPTPIQATSWSSASCANCTSSSGGPAYSSSSSPWQTDSHRPRASSTKTNVLKQNSKHMGKQNTNRLTQGRHYRPEVRLSETRLLVRKRQRLKRGPCRDRGCGVRTGATGRHAVVGLAVRIQRLGLGIPLRSKECRSILLAAVKHDRSPTRGSYTQHTNRPDEFTRRGPHTHKHTYTCARTQVQRTCRGPHTHTHFFLHNSQWPARTRTCMHRQAECVTYKRTYKRTHQHKASLIKVMDLKTRRHISCRWWITSRSMRPGCQERVRNVALKERPSLIETIFRPTKLRTNALVHTASKAPAWWRANADSVWASTTGSRPN